jgi:hypothetical protein
MRDSTSWGIAAYPSDAEAGEMIPTICNDLPDADLTAAIRRLVY